MFATIEEARKALQRLRFTRTVSIAHLCVEDRIVLSAEGFSFQAWGDSWLVWRRVD